MPAWTDSLFDNGYDMAIVTGTDGLISHVTPSVTRVLGYAPDEVLGRSGFDFIHVDDLPSALAGEALVLRDPAANPMLEVRARHRDGSLRWLEYVLTNHLDRPEVRGVVANIRDITRRRGRERQLATASHEIRAPLTLIIGIAQTLRWAWDDITDEDRLAFIAKIEHRGQQLAQIVEDMLMLASASVDDVDRGEQACRVEAAIREAIDASGGGPDIDLRCPPELVAHANERRLAQILVNLLTNAVRYGAPPFEVDARADGEWVEIKVRDHGPGVPPEFVADLFEPFSQAPAAHHPTVGSSGLGLSIVRELAHAQGGEAWYEADATPGSCFVVRLPAPHVSSPDDVD